MLIDVLRLKFGAHAQKQRTCRNSWLAEGGLKAEGKKNVLPSKHEIITVSSNLVSGMLFILVLVSSVYMAVNFELT